MTVYLRCCYCGTMKPNASDPDDELDGIREALLNNDVEDENPDGSRRSTYEMTVATLDVLAHVVRRLVDQDYEIKALRAALPEGYVLAERPRPVVADGGPDAPRQRTLDACS